MRCWRSLRTVRLEFESFKQRAFSVVHPGTFVRRPVFQRAADFVDASLSIVFALSSRIPCFKSY